MEGKIRPIAELQHVLDSLPAAFIVIDASRRYVVFNRAADDLLGGRPADGDRSDALRYIEAFHGDAVTPLAPDDNPLVRAIGGEVVQGARLFVRSERAPDGRHVVSNAGPIRDADGEIVGAVAVLHDVSDRVAAERRLRQTQEMLERSQRMEAIGRLAGAVAHDFNNVLTVVASYAHLLEPELDPADPRRADVAEIRRAAERAGALTRQLLTLSRQSPIQVERIDPSDAVRTLEPVLRRLLGAPIELTVRGDRLPRIDVDAGQLDQVLMNLAVNARDAMPDGGHLTIETSARELDGEAAAAHGLAPGGYVLVEVTDDGTGMDPETRRRVFEPFFTTKDAARGTGLGLSIVHGIVTQAGGTITVYSEPGHGTTFRIYLPVATGEAAPPPRAEVAAPERLPPVSVLVVDDDHQVRTVAARILQAAGCNVIEAASVAEAERACVAHEGAIDVVLSDVVLGDGRGDALATRLVELRPQLRVVLTSGFPPTALARAGDEPHRLVPKPFVPAELRAAIAGALGGTGGAAAAAGRAEVRAQPRVLIVDDDDLVRRGLTRVLGAAGFAVAEATGGREAVAMAEATPFDVVISDIQMPGGGGLDLLRDVRRVDLDVPVILITGQPDVRSAAQAIEHGAFRYLTKPLDFGALEKAVRHAARAHALARIRRDAFRAGGGHARAAADRAGLEVRLDAALDGLWLAFQPIVHARDGTLFGYEALMRSDEPSMPGPQHVLDAGTELGRIHHIGRRVRALGAAAFERLDDDACLFVNLHPDDLADAELIADGAPLVEMAPRVVLEVTERASLRASEGLTRRLARLRQLGFRLAIDDIGAGYSGLSTFADLIPEVVKVDMSLVRDVHVSAVKQRTIHSLCTLSHEVGSLVVGEGVETPAERDCLIDLGCDLLQGYLMGRPSREL